MRKHNCEVKTMIGCNNQVVRLMTGVKKDDPRLKFWCCIGCRAILSRQGVKMKEVTSEKG